jgi:hypothetical protein
VSALVYGLFNASISGEEMGKGGYRFASDSKAWCVLTRLFFGPWVGAAQRAVRSHPQTPFFLGFQGKGIPDGRRR